MKKLLYSGLMALMMIFSIGFAQADNAKVKVELNPTTWTIGTTAPQFTVTITQATSTPATEAEGDGETTTTPATIELGTAAGNVAVKVTLTKDGTTEEQVITSSPVALTTTNLTAGTWTLTYAFVKGDAQSNTFENVDNDASTASLTVVASVPETLEAPTIMATTGVSKGFVAKGTQVNILAPDEEGVELWYTVDGSAPGANVGTKGPDGIAQLTINEAMTIKAIAVKGTLVSDVTEAEFKLPEDLKDATVMIASMGGDKFLKNYPAMFGIVSEEYAAIEDAIPAFYYTMDGETEPSMEAYEAQTDKENGVIKAIEFGGMPYFNPTKNSISLKVKGYAMVGESIEAGYFTAATLDTVLTVESEVNPEITVAHKGVAEEEGVVVKGDTIVIKNNSEGRGSSVYFSVDGTAPTAMTMLLDEDIAGESIFWFDEEIKIVIDQDEDGAYKLVFEANGEEQRFAVKNRKISIQAICYTPEGEGMGASAMKGSDLITAEYTIPRPTVDLSFVTPSRTGGSYAEPDTTYGTVMPEFSVKVEGVELGYDVTPVSAIDYKVYRFIDGKDSLANEGRSFDDTFEIGSMSDILPNDTYKMVIRVVERSEEQNENYEREWTPYTDAEGKVAELTVYFEIAAPVWTLVSPELKTVEGEFGFEKTEPIQLRRGKDMEVVIAAENCEGLFGNGEDKMIIRKKVSAPSLMKIPAMFGDRGMIQNDGYVIYDTMIPADGNIVWTLPEGWVDSVRKFIAAEVAAIVKEMEDDPLYEQEEIEEFREQVAFKDEEDLSDCKISVQAGTMMDMSDYGREGMMFMPSEDYPSMNIEVPFSVIDTIYAPTLSLESGEVTVNTDLWITADLATDTIYYSVDEGAFQKGENNHTVTILLDKDMKVSAYAIGKDGRKSSTVSATYTVVEEPEDSELTVKAVGVEEGENVVFNEKNVAFDMFVKNVVENDTLVVTIYTKEQYDTMGQVEPTKFAVADSVRFTTTLEYGEYVGMFSVVRKSDKVGEVVAGEAVTIHFTVKEGQGGDDPSANEAGELAGVNVYPNPNAGTFNVAVPERARIDIFGLNGAKVLSREVNAGVEAFSLDHSGIYFIRVMAGNKTAVKRVVVR